jgi:hypothetical protein
MSGHGELVEPRTTNHPCREVPPLGGELHFILRNRLSAGLKSDMLQSDTPFVNLSRMKEEVDP